MLHKFIFAVSLPKRRSSYGLQAKKIKSSSCVKVPKEAGATIRVNRVFTEKWPLRTWSPPPASSMGNPESATETCFVLKI